MELLSLDKVTRERWGVRGGRGERNARAGAAGKGQWQKSTRRTPWTGPVGGVLGDYRWEGSIVEGLYSWGSSAVP